eukprot:15145042-Alexandrium_andersonii.AAC.1
MDGQAAGRIHSHSADPATGPGGPAPEVPGAGQTDDGQLEADLEAVMDWVGNFEHGPPTENLEDLQPSQ